MIPIRMTAAACMAAALTACSSAATADLGTPPPSPTTSASTTTAPAIPPSSPDYNCMTMGTHRCGKAWIAMTPAQSKAWGMTSHLPCMIKFGDTTWIACQDGFITSS